MTLKNIVILTPGLSGSSVLTGLLKNAGYWSGEETATAGYETYEDTRLIELNNEILSAAGFSWHDTADLPPPRTEDVRSTLETLDTEPFVRFVASYQNHRPWVWKDPRLSYTIHFWGDLLPLDDCRFLLMNRVPRTAWIGLLRKNRMIVAERHLRRIHQAKVESARSFLRSRSIEHLELDFDELVMEPDRQIARLNEHLGTSLTLGDFSGIYRGSLGSRRWKKHDYLLSWLRYLAGWLRGNAVSFPRTE